MLVADMETPKRNEKINSNETHNFSIIMMSSIVSISRRPDDDTRNLLILDLLVRKNLLRSYCATIEITHERFRI